MIRRLVVIALLPGVLGCGTISRGTRQEIEVRTAPSAATIRVLGCGVEDASYESPVVLTVSRTSDTCTFRISKKGYRPVSVRLVRVEKPVYYLTCCNSESAVGPYGTEYLLHLLVIASSSAVDSFSGASYVLVPRLVLVTLDAEETAQPDG